MEDSIRNKLISEISNPAGDINTFMSFTGREEERIEAYKAIGENLNGDGGKNSVIVASNVSVLVWFEACSW